MHILITDSGVGGLSVCAFAERFLRNHSTGKSVRLTYVNASPENDFGYNSMASRSEKIEFFDRFLNIISDRFRPDFIFIACNTLSVLFPDTQFSRNATIQVQGIVETGVNLLVRVLSQSPHSKVAIFGTPTTIDEMAYPHLLEKNGIDGRRVISQACPSLADTISEDRQGLDAKRKIEQNVAAVVGKMEEGTTDLFVFLACTHYGYRKGYFKTAFKEKDIETKLINPNELVVGELFSKCRESLKITDDINDIRLEFVTRYRIPETALETIAFFLDGVSPATVQAFKNFTHAPDLF